MAVNIEIMRTFVRVRELEEKTEALAIQHDIFSRNTRNQLRQVFDALRELMTPPEPAKRPIGFVTQEDKARSFRRQKARPYDRCMGNAVD